jgi:hypothetical protein
MARVRKIQRNPNRGKNYYIIDACFLANRFIPAKIAPDEKEKTRIKSCMEWWGEIEAQ